MAPKRKGSTVPHKQAEQPCKRIRVDVSDAGATTGILAHHIDLIQKKFPGIAETASLSMEDGAALPPFNSKTLLSRIAEGRAYKCCCSIFALNLMDNPSPQVPICQRQVDELINFFFPTAPDLDSMPEFVAAVPSMKVDTEKAWGAFHQVSPFEMTIAIIQACSRDMGSKDLNLVEKWRRALLAIQMDFRYFDTKESAFMYGVQLRQKEMQEGISLQRTPLQWACEIIAFRDMVAFESGGKVPGAQALAQKFLSAELKFATNAEPPTKTFIENVITIHNRMLAVPEIKEAILQAEELFGPTETPFQKVNTLYIIMTKASSPERIHFAVTMMTKLVHSGVMDLSELGARKLKGMDGHHSVVEYFNMVNDIKSRLISHHAQNYGWDPKFVEETRVTFATVKAYENKMDGNRDLTWQATYPKSLVAFWDILESLLFTKRFSESISSGLRSHRSALDILEAPEFKDLLDVISDAAKAEQADDGATVVEPVARSSLSKNDECQDGRDTSINPKGETDCPGIVAAIETLPGVPVDALRVFADKAEKFVKRSISMIPMPSKGTPLSQQIEASPVGSMRGTNVSPIGILYDHKLSGESSSKPSVRAPPLNEEHMKNSVGSVMASRSDPTTLAEGDQYIFSDGGKPGLEHTFGSIFKSGRAVMQKHKRTVTILYGFQSVAARRERERDSNEMNVVEQIFMFSKDPIKLSVKDRVGFHGQNTSNGVGPVPMPCLDTSMKSTWGHKKEIFGPNIRLVGGAGGTAASDEKPCPRKNDDVEVVFYHSMSHEWYMDFVSSGCFTAIIDLTPGDGGCAFACILQGVPLLAVTMNQAHSDVLYKHLVKRVFGAMMVATSPSWLFEPKLAEIAGKSTAPVKTTVLPVVPKPETEGSSSTASPAHPPPGGEPQGNSMLSKLKDMLDKQKKG